MTTPTTEAGQALDASHAAYLGVSHGAGGDAALWRVEQWRKDILAIERQSRRQVLVAVRERLPEMMKAALPGAFLQADDLALGSEAAGRILDELAEAGR